MTIRKIFFLCFIAVIFSGCADQVYDVLILNGTVYDGKGNPGQQLDLGITDGKIVAIGDLKNEKGDKIIDATNLAVSPGFIDLHAHLEPIMEGANCLSALHQGVTTALGGPDGSSPFPIKSYLDSLETFPLGINVAYLVGHNTVRKLVMNLDNRAPTPDELNSMKDKIEEGMKEGAFGMSTGLKYLPGAFSKVDEVIELSRVAAKHGGFYTSHLREEGLGLIPAVQEAIQIGYEAKIPIVLTHHKVVGKPSWGNSKITLHMVDSANQAGLDIQIDQYPYTASSTSLSILIPSWAMAGGNEEFKKRVKDPEMKKKIKEEILYNILNDRGAGDIKNIQLSKVSWLKEIETKTLADYATLKGIAPTPENGADLIIEVQEKGGASVIFHAMNEEDVKNIMKHPKTMIASDGRISFMGVGNPHPRAYGTFPRILGKYVREDKVLTLEEAINKMSYLPAQRMGLEDRGAIVKGNIADIVVFDPKTVIDKATFANPHQYPDGILYVLVNGVVSISKGEVTNDFSGKVLRKQLKK